MPLARCTVVAALFFAGCTTAARSPNAATRPTIAPTASMPASMPATAPVAEQPVHLPFVTVDRAARQVRIECEALALVDTPLEFLCVAVGGPEHEAVLRTRAKPSHIHAGLLLLGLRPGSPVVYDERNNTWIPPHGPPVRAIAEWTDAAGASHRLPAEQLMCSIKDGTPMPPTSFIFAGSHVRPDDGAYLADFTGYVVSICNFEHTLLDVPRLVSSANETLEWQTDLVHGPAKGTAVTLILEPVDAPSTQPSEDPQIIELERRRQALLDEAHRIDQQIQNVRAAATAPVH